MYGSDWRNKHHVVMQVIELDGVMLDIISAAEIGPTCETASVVFCTATCLVSICNIYGHNSRALEKITTCLLLLISPPRHLNPAAS